MLGPIGGSSGSMGEIKQLLELVSDPKKLAKAIADLEKVSDETKKILEEKSKLESDIDSKLKKLDKEKLEAEKLIAASKKLEYDVATQKAVYDAANADLKTREFRLSEGLKALEKEKLALDAEKTDFSKFQSDKHKEIAEELDGIKKSKLDLEEKFKKLKQVMG